MRTIASSPKTRSLRVGLCWYSRLYLQPLSGGDAKLVTKANRHVVSFALSPDFTRAVYAAQPSPANRDSLHTSTSTKSTCAPGADVSWSRNPVATPILLTRQTAATITFHSQAGSQNYFEARHVGLVPTWRRTNPLHHTRPAIRCVPRRQHRTLARSRAIIYTAGRGLTDVLVKHDLKSNTTRSPDGKYLERSQLYDFRRYCCLISRSSAEHPPEIFLRDAKGERQLTHLQEWCR